MPGCGSRRLLHDAPEYVIGDMISPFKAVLGGDYKAVEARLLSAIHIRFGLPPVLADQITRQIKEADRGAAYLEATQLAGFAASRGEAAVRPRSRPARGDGAGLSDALDARPRPRSGSWRGSRRCTAESNGLTLSPPRVRGL